MFVFSLSRIWNTCFSFIKPFPKGRRKKQWRRANLRGTTDDGYLKEEKEIDRVLMVVLFLAFAFAGYLLVQVL